MAIKIETEEVHVLTVTTCPICRQIALFRLPAQVFTLSLVRYAGCLIVGFWGDVCHPPEGKKQKLESGSLGTRLETPTANQAPTKPAAGQRERDQGRDAGGRRGGRGEREGGARSWGEVSKGEHV